MSEGRERIGPRQRGGQRCGEQIVLIDTPETSRAPRTYGPVLTAEVNAKGVLDVDVVKGCSAGMGARPGTGCYASCYAAKIAAFRGIDFTVSVTRTAETREQRKAVEEVVRRSPQGFFRIGVMGDPAHDWETTVKTVEWLAPLARPVIITKHWRRLTDEQVARLVVCRVVLNTSVSGLDTEAELAHRLREVERYRTAGGRSVARVVSCKFNRSHPEGARMGAIQDRLFATHPMLDNPLRAPRSHPLAVSGIIELSLEHDLGTRRTISLERKDTYLGHCSGCPDLCGIESKSACVGTGTAQLELGDGYV